jgi:hypothetical protein
LGTDGGILGHGFVDKDDKPTEAEWNGEPKDVNAAPDFNLNEEPVNPQS